MSTKLKTLIAIIIVVLFIGSMFVTILYRNSDNNNIQNINNDQNLTEEYYNSIVDANVVSKLSKFVISSQTEEYELTTIESKIKEIEGIKTVNGGFNNIDENTIAFIGHISYNTKYREEILEKLQNISFFTSLETYEYALVEIPQDLNLTSMLDENITKEYYLPTKKYEGIISTQTLKGDKISASLQAAFKGEELFRIMVVEMQNISAQPKMVSDIKTYPILSWNKEINIKTDTNIENNIDFNSILDYNYSINKSYLGNLKYKINEIEINDFDINKELNLIKDQNNSYIENINLDENYLDISFNNNLNEDLYSELKEKINIDFNISNNFIEQEPIKNIDFIVFEEDININETKDLFSLNNLNISEITKSAIIDISDTNIENTIYNYDQNTTTTNLLYPKNKHKNEITFDVSLYATRKDIMFFMINEKIEEIDEE